MALEGTIKDCGIPDIFQLIGLQRKTGILTLTSNENVTVAFENGMVVMADSSSKRLEDRLGNVLVKQGKLSKERMEEALETQKLTLEEERIFRRVDGARTVQAIIDASGAGEFEVCRTLFDFLNRNIIAPVGRGEARATRERVVESIASATPGYIVTGLVVLLAIVGVLAQLGSRFAVTGLPPTLRRSYNQVLEAMAVSRLQRLDQALQAHQLATGAPARSLQDLVARGLVDMRYLTDPWGRPYHYVPQGGGYLLSGVDDLGRDKPGVVIER